MKKLIVEISYFDNVLGYPLSAGQEIVVTDERAKHLLKIKDGLDRSIVKESSSKNTGKEIYMEGTQPKKPSKSVTPKEDLQSPAKTWKQPEAKSEPMYTKESLKELSRTDLQGIAKSLDIKANQKTDILISIILKENAQS